MKFFINLMNSLLLTLCFLFISTFSLMSSQAASIQVDSIWCNDKINPMGVSINDVDFSWKLTSEERNQHQTALRIVVSSSRTLLESGAYDVWDSGKIETQQNLNTPYVGTALGSGKTYYWQVKVWDKDQTESEWSQVGKFVTGLDQSEDWAPATWIGYEKMSDAEIVVPGIHGNGDNLGDRALKRPVAPLFRKEFQVKKKVVSALLFISGLGHYEASINGEKVGDAFLSPGWTKYDKTCLYNTYDVTENLKSGDNALGIIVGNGFYNINRERYRKLVIAYGMPKTICKLSIKYDDGSVQTVATEDSWKTSPSPITYNSIFGGEDYDARMEQSGWDQTGFDDSKWKTAISAKVPQGKLVAEIDYPLNVMQTIKVKEITKLSSDSYLYDYGQNASGIIELKVKGKKGHKIILQPGELIDDKHHANQNASGKPYIYSYILKGDGEEVWRPRFTYYGFRYVQVDGATPHENQALPQILSLKLLHTRNAAPLNGQFSCSSPLFNRIYTLIQWAIKSNLQSVVTDCPHREKLGWMEQTHLMGGGIHYNFSINHLYQQLVMDMIDSQESNGLVPDIAPEYVEFDGGFRDSPEWGSAAVILPWYIYKWYGNQGVIENAWPMMKKYVDYLRSKAEDNILSHGLGDWYDLGPKFPGEAQLTPKALTATATYYYDAALLSKMSRLIGKVDDSEKYFDLSEKIKNSFNQKFFDENTNIYSTGSQTAMAMPLCVGLVDEKNRQKVFNNLVLSIENSDKALTAGDVGFHYLIKALEEGGAAQLIFEMNNRDDIPGYGYQLKKGATALTESWAALREVSNNHLMLGHIMEWFYSGLAGIGQTEDSVAYKTIEIKPQFVEGINWAKASYDCPSGTIKSGWRTTKDSIFLSVTIPVNSGALVHLPAQDISSIMESGKRLKDIKDIIIESSPGDEIILRLGCGSYDFEIIR